MDGFTKVFNVGQKVVYHNTDFDTVKPNIVCEVLDVYEDKMTVLDIETNTKLYIEKGFNDDCIIPILNASPKSLVFKAAANKMSNGGLV